MGDFPSSPFSSAMSMGKTSLAAGAGEKTEEKIWKNSIEVSWFKTVSKKKN